jgi:hypothetical protein
MFTAVPPPTVSALLNSTLPVTEARFPPFSSSLLWARVAIAPGSTNDPCSSNSTRRPDRRNSLARTEPAGRSRQ